MKYRECYIAWAPADFPECGRVGVFPLGSPEDPFAISGGAAFGGATHHAVLAAGCVDAD
jgi:hypothetical protein